MLGQFDHIVSLGARCQTAYQIRRYFDVQTPYPFDWWVTPTLSLVELLENDFAGLFEPENIDVGPDGRRWAACRKTGIIHAHDFGSDIPARDPIDLAMIPARCEANRRRYGVLIDWFHRLEGRVLFIRFGRGVNKRNDLAAEHSTLVINRIAAAVDKMLPDVDPRFLILSGDAKERPDLGFSRGGIDHRVALDRISHDPEGRWQGDDAAWDEMFGRHGGRDMLRRY